MSDINKFLALQTALINEKASIESRLAEISRVLGGDVSAPSPASPAPSATATKGKRTFSAATRAKMKVSQQARWAKKKGTVVVNADVGVAKPKKAKRTMSEATKAKMRAAHQARWAKLKGKTGSSPTPVAATAPAAKKAKRVISPDRR